MHATSYDSTRETSPLKRAEDAFEIDTLSIDEVVMKILELKDSTQP